METVVETVVVRWLWRVGYAEAVYAGMTCTSLSPPSLIISCWI
jgi:hypothetical protein